MKKNNNEIIQRLESHYVSDDCCQIMLPFTEKTTILSDKGIMFHRDDNVVINEYIKDERRKKFPYHNIPTHLYKIPFIGKVGYTNQILEYEKPIIRVFEGYAIESFAVKDNSNALLVHKTLYPIEEKTIISLARSLKRDTDEYITREELIKLLEPNEDEEIFYITSDGQFYTKMPIPEEIIILSFLKENMQKKIQEIKKYIINNDDSLGDYLEQNAMLSFMQECSDKVDFKTLNFNADLCGGNILLVVRIKGENITIKGYTITFKASNKYYVDEYNIPVTKYTLEQLKFGVSKIEKTKEPKISLGINPGVTKQDIKKAKQMIKTLKSK